MNNEIAFDIDSNFYSLGAVLGTADDAKFDSDKFNSMFDGNHDKDLKIFHLNMCSFPRNVNTLLGYLSTIKQQFDIICLTETWLNEGRFIENYFSDYNKFYSKRPANQSLGDWLKEYSIVQNYRTFHVIWIILNVFLLN